LILSEFFVSEHQNGTTFWSISILVRITRNRCHAWNSEIIELLKWIA
jgi:hypothetical protein